MDKPQFPDKILHNNIITVRINTQMPALFKCPGDTECPDPFFRPVPGDSVDNAVRAAVEPCAIRYFPVCRLDIFPIPEEKGSDDSSFLVEADVTVSVLDIVTD